MGKKVMLRCIALLLVLVTLSVMVIGCGGDTDPVDPGKKPSDSTGKDTGSADDSGNDSDSEVETGDKPIEVIDMDGYVFNVLARVTSWFANEVTAEDETGDLVLQSIYDRNFNIEERYNCILESTFMDEGKSGWTIWQTSVNSGENAYKASLNHMMDTATEALNGSMLNLLDLGDYVNLDASYWNQSMNKELIINNRLYFTANEYCTSSVYFTWLMIFNMEMADQKGIDVYGMVDDGTWTYDSLYDIVSKSYADDGNGVVDLATDTFGLVTHYNTVLTNYLFAFEVPVVHIDNSGKVVFDYNDPNTMMNSVVEKIYDLLFESNNGAFYMTEAAHAAAYSGLLHDDAIATKFATNTSLFSNIRLLALETLRSAEATYGIVPFPKYTEEQQNYHSHVDGRGSLIFAPYTLPENEYENVGILLDALAKETQEVIMPVITKTALIGRYSEDQQAYNCLKMIFDGRTYAFAYVYDFSTTSHPYWAIVNCMSAKSDSFTDYWKAKSRTAEREINQIYSKYAKLHSSKK